MEKISLANSPPGVVVPVVPVTRQPMLNVRIACRGSTVTMIVLMAVIALVLQ